MLPTNVMSFVKKIVSSNASAPNVEDDAKDKGLSKPKTLVLFKSNDGQPVKERNATSPVPENADMSHLTAEEISILEKVFQKQQQFEKEEATRRKSDSPVRPTSRLNSCRICLKGLAATDIYHTCCECQQKVCEDCSSYSKQDDSSSDDSWMCSICRRKIADQQKTYDPDVLSRIARRGTIRKSSGSDLAAASPASLSTDDSIDTKPNLRPNTLNTVSAAPMKSDYVLLDGKSQAWRDMKEQLISPRSYNHTAQQRQEVKRWFKEQQFVETSCSAPQTPCGRPVKNLQGSNAYDTHRTRKHGSVVRPLNSEPEDSDRYSTDIPNEYRNLFPENGTDRRAPRRNHELRHVNSDSGGASGVMGKYRLSAEILNDRLLRQSPSTSDSSLEDFRREEAKEQEYWRRKKSKVKRKSRIQRQRSYHDDLEGDRSDRGASKGGRHFGTSSNGEEEDDGVANGKVNYPFGSDFQQHNHSQDMLSVPGHSKIHRHHSWDASLASRRYSSESSDVSDVGADFPASLDHDTPESQMDEFLSAEQGDTVHSSHLNFLKPRAVKKLSRKKPVESEEDYDAEQSATMESSPSPENMERHSFQKLERRTSSEDNDVFKGGRSSRRSSQNSATLSQANLPAKIPIVEVHVVEQFGVGRTDLKVDDGTLPSEKSAGRALPKIPNHSSRLVPAPPVVTPKTRQSKSVDLTNLGSERNSEVLLRRSTLADFESVKIVIDDVDSDHLREKTKKVLQRKVILSRMSADGGPRARGFGMRVVGGKIGEDGRLFAYVVWTVPDGPAELNGISKGDKVLEWDGESLVDRTFEEVAAIIDHSRDEASIVTEHVIEGARHGSFDIGHAHEHILRRCSEGTGLDMLAAEGHINDPQSTRRRLPKPPELTQGVIAGEVQLVVWYDPDQPVLTITVAEAQDLPLRNDNSLPETYAKVRLLPEKNNSAFKTPVSEPSANPTWNEIFNYTGISNEDILEKFLIISIWDIISSDEKRSLGEVVLQLRKCEMDGRAEWYRLQDRRSLFTAAHSAPKLSLSAKSLLVPKPEDDILHNLQLKRKEFQLRSMSDDIDEQLALELIGHMVKSTSVDSKLLHPEQAWNRDRRRSSSGSEKSDASTRSCPHTLPSTRNNSISADPYCDYHQLQDQHQHHHHHRTKSVKLPKKDALNAYQENNGPLKSTTKSDKLSRSLSLKGDKRFATPGPKEFLLPPSGSRWSSNSSLETSDDEENSHNKSNIVDDGDLLKYLGPGQFSPKHFTGILGLTQRKVKLGIIITKGFLEIDVICAKGVGYSTAGNPPDTYVKTYLKDGEKLMQKKKTRIIRQCIDPQYRQTLKYSVSEIVGRSLLVMVWERQKGFDHNHAIGAAQINPAEFELNKLIIGWYRLFPMAKIESESNEST